MCPSKYLLVFLVIIGFHISTKAQLLKEVNKTLKELNNTTREVKKLGNSLTPEKKKQIKEPPKKVVRLADPQSSKNNNVVQQSKGNLKEKRELGAKEKLPSENNHDDIMQGMETEELVQDIPPKNCISDELCINFIRSNAKKIVETRFVTQISGNHRFRGIGNYSIAERHSDGSPRLIEFDYVAEFYVVKRDPKQDKFGTIYCYFEKGYPVALYNKKSKFLSSKYPLDIKSIMISPVYTESELDFIDKTYKKFRIDNLKDNQSFQEALATVKGYPLASDPNKCLAIITKTEKYYTLDFSYSKAVLKNRNGAIVMWDPLKDEINVSTIEKLGEFKYYKNVCKHDVIIRGIYKKYNHSLDPKYSDGSYILKPNESMDYFRFTIGGYNDDSEYNLQYFVNAESILPK